MTAQTQLTGFGSVVRASQSASSSLTSSSAFIGCIAYCHVTMLSNLHIISSLNCRVAGYGRIFVKVKPNDSETNSEKVLSVINYNCCGTENRISYSKTASKTYYFMTFMIWFIGRLREIKAKSSFSLWACCSVQLFISLLLLN